MLIRKERESDYEAITEVTTEAFKTLEISQHTEQFIIHALRQAGALALSLVAVIDGKVVGHVAFSPITISDGSTDWYGLGPVSVLPELHRQGIGSALIKEGLDQLKAMNAKGCVLVGDPNYYTRLGFKPFQELILEGVPAEYFLALAFDDSKAQGKVEFHPGFAAKS